MCITKQIALMTFLVMVFLVQLSRAEVLRQEGDLWVATVPFQVVLHADGSVEVRTKTWSSRSRDSLLHRFENFVPTYSSLDDGKLIPGVLGMHQNRDAIDRPKIVLKPDDTYAVINAHAIKSIGFVQQAEGENREADRVLALPVDYILGGHVQTERGGPLAHLSEVNSDALRFQFDEATGRFKIRVPNRVIVHQREERFEIQYTELLAPTRAALESRLPRFVEVYESLPNGSLAPGIAYRNDSDRSSTQASAWIVEEVEVDRFGQFAPRMSVQTIPGWESVPDQPGKTIVPPHSSKWIDGSQVVRIRYQQTARSDVRGDGFNIIFDLDAGSVPAPLTVVNVQQVLFRVEQNLENLLQASTGQVTFEIAFEDLDGDVGSSVYSGAPYLYSDARTFLQNAVNLEGQVPDTTLFDHTFPPGGMQVVRDGPPIAVVDVVITDAVRAALGILGGDQNNGSISLDSVGPTWDPDDSDGVDGHSLEAVTIHEAIHLLGFQSLAGDMLQPATRVFGWDSVRFARSLLQGGAQLAPAQVAGQPRMLMIGTDAIAVVRFFHTLGIYDLAGGMNDDDQPSHWQSFMIGGVRLGIMDPDSAPNLRLRSLWPKYMSLADRMALDAMGYNINVIPQADPPPPVNQAPLDGDPNASLTPTLQWTQPSGSVSHVVYVYAGDVVGPSGSYVFQSAAVASNSLVVPSGVLLLNNVYTWLVHTNYSGGGFVLSEPTTFTTVGCRGDADCNGVVNVNDISFVIFRLGTMGLACPGPVAQGDVDGNGTVDVNDISVVTFEIGMCNPAPCACPN